MNKKEIILSAAGLKNVIIKEDEEFIFKIGEKKLKMNKIFAEFLSPRVSHIHHCDPTINFINLSELFTNKNDTNKINKIIEELGNENILTHILNLSQGNSIEIENENEQTIKSIIYFSILVNNEELYNKMNEYQKTIKTDTKSINETLEEIEFLYEINQSFNSHHFSKLIDEISSKINTNNSNILKVVPKHILYLIIYNENFQYEDMDSLLDIINEIFSIENEQEEEEEYNLIHFYELIDIDKLSDNKFIQFISNLNYRELTFNLWSKLCDILLNYASDEKKENHHTNEVKKIEFDGQLNHRFNGIIHYLQGSEKTNICDRNIINVTSSTYQGNFLPKNAVDFDSNNYFFSNYDDDWLKYDFKEKKIRPTHYSIKTRNDNDDWNPVNWFIEVSNTDKDDDWRIIDSRTGVKSVSKRNQSDTFDISTHLSDNEYYRYIRFRCNGNTSGLGNTWLAISSLEYFGNLIE